jgi:ferredoxin
LRYFPEDRIRRDLCTACGTCSEVCPAGAVSLSADGVPGTFGASCIGCGHCGAYCPSNCFALDPQPSVLPDGDSVRDLLASRRSCRFFLPDPLSGAEIDRLLSAVGYSPSGTNAGGLVIRVVNGREEVGRLLDAARGFVRTACRTGIPQLITKMAGMGGALRRFRSGEDLLFREAPAVLFFHVPRGNVTWRTDGVIAAANVVAMASAIGVSTLWNGFAGLFYPLVRAWHHPSARGTRLAAVLCAGRASKRPLREVPAREFTALVSQAPASWAPGESRMEVGTP